MSLPKRIKLTATGWALRVIGLSFYLCGATILIILVMRGGEFLSRMRPFGLAIITTLGLFITVVPAVILLYLGHFIFESGKKRIAKGKALKAKDLSSHDTRPPILYLRSFIDDRITSDILVVYDTLPTLSTEEENLAKAVGNIGPFLALSNPNAKRLPQLGAIRISADEQSWQSKVIDLMLCAQMVIFRVGSGTNLWWEIEQAIKNVRPERLLFLIPNDVSTFQSFRQKFQPLIPHDIPDFVGEKQIPGTATIGAILYFGSDGMPRLSPLKNREFRVGKSQPLRQMLRLALKPIFNQLNLRWTPPPVPLHIVAPAVFWGIIWILGMRACYRYVSTKAFSQDRLLFIIILIVACGPTYWAFVSCRRFLYWLMMLYPEINPFKSPKGTQNSKDANS